MPTSCQHQVHSILAVRNILAASTYSRISQRSSAPAKARNFSSGDWNTGWRGPHISDEELVKLGSETELLRVSLLHCAAGCTARDPNRPACFRSYSRPTDHINSLVTHLLRIPLPTRTRPYLPRSHLLASPWRMCARAGTRTSPSNRSLSASRGTTRSSLDLQPGGFRAATGTPGGC